MERVLVREPYRPMALVRDPGAQARSLAGSHLGDGDLERRVAAIGRPERGRGSDPRRRGVSGEERELVLDRLEAPDRPPELLALAYVLHRLREEVFEPPGHLGGPDEGPVPANGVGSHRGADAAA